MFRRLINMYFETKQNKKKENIILHFSYIYNVLVFSFSLSLFYFSLAILSNTLVVVFVLRIFISSMQYTN